MAKKKKGSRKHHKVGGLKLSPRNPAVMLAAVGLGMAADYFFNVNDMINQVLPGTVTTPATGTTPAVHTPTATMNNVAAGAQVGLGALLMLKKKKSLVTTAIGGVSAGLGVMRVLREMKIIGGYQDTPVLGAARRMGGYQNTPVLGGMPSQLSGVPNALTGYIPAGSGSMGGYVPAGSGLMGSTRDGSGYRD